MSELNWAYIPIDSSIMWFQTMTTMMEHNKDVGQSWRKRQKSINEVTMGNRTRRGAVVADEITPQIDTSAADRFSSLSQTKCMLCTLAVDDDKASNQLHWIRRRASLRNCIYSLHGAQLTLTITQVQPLWVSGHRSNVLDVDVWHYKLYSNLNVLYNATCSVVFYNIY